jgi:hypothetical protein
VSDGGLVASQVLWDIALFIVIVAIVPLVLVLAARLVHAAKAIAIEFKVTLAAAGGVARNTQPTEAALDQTIATAGAILATAGRINEHSAAVDGLLTQRAGVNGR